MSCPWQMDVTLEPQRKQCSYVCSVFGPDCGWFTNHTHTRTSNGYLQIGKRQDCSPTGHSPFSECPVRWDEKVDPDRRAISLR